MKPDGGPAFPIPEYLSVPEGQGASGGMSLRDYFAAHAPEPYPDWHGGERLMKDIIEWRWYYADAMLAERDK